VAADSVEIVHGRPVLMCSVEGPRIADGSAALDLIGDAMYAQVEWLAVPVGRFADEFFTLRTGLAGEIAQKFVNYRLRLAVVGDISRHIAASTAFRDFVHETNRGRQLWFVDSRAELDERLSR
jgi:hypothetical protein